MEYVNDMLIGLLLFFLLKRLLPTQGVKQITTSELRIKNKQFVDVRTPGEFKSNHNKGFKNIPLHELNQKANQLSKDQEVILICQSGMRSNKASKILKKLGYKTITNVKGGMSAWN